MLLFDMFIQTSVVNCLLQVTVTSRHLVSMMGGIRHYDKLCRKETAAEVPN